MKNNLWLRYGVYIILMVGLIYLNEYIIKQTMMYTRENFRFNYFLVIMTMLIKICIGLLLGIEYLFKELRKNGVWKINYPKVVFMIIPSLYFSLTYLFMDNVENPLQRLFTYPLSSFLKNGTNFVSIFQIIIGYFLITSFYKKDNCNTKKEIIT